MALRARYTTRSSASPPPRCTVGGFSPTPSAACPRSRGPVTNFPPKDAGPCCPDHPLDKGRLEGGAHEAAGTPRLLGGRWLQLGPEGHGEEILGQVAVEDPEVWLGHRVPEHTAHSLVSDEEGRERACQRSWSW